MPITPSDAVLVQALAHHAALPLGSDRIEPVSQILNAWIKDANALSLKMSSPKYMDLAPITGLLQVVNHGEVAE